MNDQMTQKWGALLFRLFNQTLKCTLNDIFSGGGGGGVAKVSLFNSLRKEGAGLAH